MSRWRKERVPGGVSGEPELAVWRSGEGEPLVCLHGITAQHRSFNSLARHLGSGHEVVGVDLRGRGDSGKPESGKPESGPEDPSSYGLEAHGRDVLRVLDHLGAESATLCGHSMGAFVAVKAALLAPERVKALVLLDGAWPRVEVSEEERRAIQEGLDRAFSRLDMTFEDAGAYLDFWFPGAGLEPEDLDPDLADYYLYDLERVEGGYSPKASRKAAEEDATSISNEAPDIEELREVEPPVMLVRATEGFFPGSDPLIPDATRDSMVSALDVRSELLLHANHYSMMFGEHAQIIAEDVRKFVRGLE